MSTVQASGVNSPISDETNRRFLNYLRQGYYDRNVFTLTDGKTVAYATAVLLENGRRVNLENCVGMESSISVDDSHVPPIPRSSEFFERNPLYNAVKMADDVVGIAAYRIVYSSREAAIDAIGESMMAAQE